MNISGVHGLRSLSLYPFVFFVTSFRHSTIPERTHPNQLYLNRHRCSLMVRTFCEVRQGSILLQKILFSETSRVGGVPSIRYAFLSNPSSTTEVIFAYCTLGETRCFFLRLTSAQCQSRVSDIRSREEVTRPLIYAVAGIVSFTLSISCRIMSSFTCGFASRLRNVVNDDTSHVRVASV